MPNTPNETYEDLETKKQRSGQMGSDLDELKEGLTSLKGTVTRLVDDLRDEGMHRAKEVGGMLRERPLVVAGAALAIGIVVGRLLAPRH